MSKISLAPDASGTGIFTIASPNSNTNRTLTLPDDTGTIVTNSGNQAGSFTTLNTSGAVVFNDAGADVDFRVEGDANANLLFVDASTDRVGIGTNTPGATAEIYVTRTSSTNAVALILNDNVTGLQTNGVYKAIRSLSNNGSSVSELRFLETDGTNNNTGIAFATASSVGSLAERMRIDPSGKVGIGVTNPAVGLVVAYGTDGIIGNYFSSSGANSRISFSNTSLLNNNVSIGSSSDAMVMYTNNTERMRIDSSGNVGIGVSSIISPGSSRRALVISNSTNGGIIVLGSGAESNSPRIFSGQYDLGFAAGPSTGILQFYTNNAERMRITSGGGMSLISTADGLHVGSTQASGTSTWLFRGASAATAGTAFSGTDRFFVFTNGNVTNSNGSYGTISDAKLKQDIIDANSQWDDIKNIRFRKYRMKSDVAENPNAPYLLGFVAQELENVSPGLIEEHPDTALETKTREVEKIREVTPAALDDEGNEVTPAVTETYTETEEYTEIVDLGTTTKSIKTSILYMKAVKALQEAIERIETLEASNTALEARIAALENA
jgi:hypothetical protein